MDYLLQLYESIFGSSACQSNQPRKIVAFGNVLLDHTARLNNTELLQRFNLPLGSKGELDSEILTNLTAEACASGSCKTNPGGSALNSVRILKSLGTDALFFGAVGEDKQGEELKNLLEQRGVETRLQTITDTPTGQCICLVYEDTATLYANIGASAYLTVEHLKRIEYDKSQAFLRPIERKQILYIEGFFIPKREEVCRYIVDRYIHERRRLAVNLSGVYIVKENFEQLLSLARCAYFIFGDKLEFEAFAQCLGCESIEDAAKQLLTGGVTKIILNTKGADGVQLITNFVAEHEPPGEITFQNFNAPRVQVVDTTGAGDSFVAGFLHSWLERRPLSECVRVATEVAAQVVTQVGCNLPPKY